MSRFLSSPEETGQLAEELAKNMPGRIFALVGDLGTGKTTFAQYFFKALGVTGSIVSPTFVIIKNYQNIYHIDCYRLKNSQELLRLGFREIIEAPQNIVVVEWADKIRDILPKETIWLYFDHGRTADERIVRIESLNGDQSSTY
jgi:tRNA threonylcarbamoyladenosine biosynthesis protein TsaE